MGQIVERVNEWERIRWMEEITMKSTLGLYATKVYVSKESIGGEGGYDNSWGSVLL